MDIVKLNINGKYALRKWTIFGYVFADIDRLRCNRTLMWWKVEHHDWISVNTLEEMEQLVDNYSPKLAKQKRKEDEKRQKEAWKELMKERKERRSSNVVKSRVKFGSKNQ